MWAWRRISRLQPAVIEQIVVLTLAPAVHQHLFPLRDSKAFYLAASHVVTAEFRALMS